MYDDILALGGVRVVASEGVKIKIKKDKYEFKWDKYGHLEKIYAPEVVLVCEAIDESGNVAYSFSSPDLPVKKGDDDDDDDEDDDDDDKTGSEILANGTFEMEIGASPNPFSHELNITFESNETLEGKVQLLDIQGKLITELLNQDFNQGTRYYSTINGELLPAGVYNVVAITNKGMVSKRVVLVK